MNRIGNISSTFFHKPIYYISFLMNKIKEYAIEKFNQIYSFFEKFFCSCHTWRFSKNNPETITTRKNLGFFQPLKPSTPIPKHQVICETETDQKKQLQILHDKGQMYLDQNTPEDNEKAFKCFSEASQKDFAPSQYVLAKMYREGRRIKKNTDLSSYWLEKAAKFNFAPAQYDLGILYQDERELQKAYEYYHHAAEQGYEEAQIKICALCWDGIYTPQDREQAAIYFDLADKNMVEAQIALGTMFLNGWGVEKDLTTAIKWHEKAAVQKHLGALVILGQLYEYNTEIKNCEIAEKYYKQASELGGVFQKIHFSEFKKRQTNGLVAQ